MLGCLPICCDVYLCGYLDAYISVFLDGVCLDIQMSKYVCPSGWLLSVCLDVGLSICMFVFVFGYLDVCCLSIWISVGMSVCLMSVCVSIWMSISLDLCMSECFYLIIF